MTKKLNKKAHPVVNDSAIYQTKNGAITLKQDVFSDMLWASVNLPFLLNECHNLILAHLEAYLKWQGPYY